LPKSGKRRNKKNYRRGAEPQRKSEDKEEEKEAERKEEAFEGDYMD
jgi:hypothetical protein